MALIEHVTQLLGSLLLALAGIACVQVGLWARRTEQSMDAEAADSVVRSFPLGLLGRDASAGSLKMTARVLVLASTTTMLFSLLMVLVGLDTVRSAHTLSIDLIEGIALLMAGSCFLFGGSLLLRYSVRLQRAVHSLQG